MKCINTSMEQCKLCKKEFKNINGLAKHIHNQHKDYSKQLYYDTFIGKTTSKCKTCGSSDCTFRDIGRGYLEYCSHDCFKNNEEVRQTQRENATGKVQRQETIDKRRNTIIEKYGVACGFLTGKNKPENYKGFCCRSSYEKKFVDFAEEYNYTLKVPKRINYEFEGRKRWYFPDFYIVELNTLIEVKSKWTYALQKELNEAKLLFTRAANHNIIVVDETNGLIDNWKKLNEYLCSIARTRNCC